ncbi:MAG: DUF1353 domain-containing protein [Sulfurospirillaceae bacterium]|nr:DUF1353 domain-containing protein [Sulfurospirillaceae bacterium]
MFTSALEVKKIGDQKYELTAPLVYEDGAIVIQVNPEFDFDAISIPKIFWSIIDSPFTGKAVRAACLHDALYAGEVFERQTCDNLFLEAMESEGVGYFKRYAMYNAVRFFGGSVWRNHNKEEVNEYKKFVTVLGYYDV